jgi:hypothetical protein
VNHERFLTQQVNVALRFFYGAIFKQEKIAMKKHIFIPLAAALLMTTATAMAAGAPKATDTLNLTSAQQKTAWNDLYMPSLNQKAPSGFEAVVGAVIPEGVTIAPVPTKAASAVPSLRPYDFAMTQGKLVIVNPSDKKIAAVIVS